MKQRCYNVNHADYARYVGRGIRVHARWLESFEAFLEDMVARPSRRHYLDRKKNDENYSPENCRWATSIEQNNNTRLNRSLTFNGVMRTLAEWARELGIPWNTIRNRVRRNWSTERVLTTPKGRYSWQNG
jgi:hypothetical protein